MPSIRSLARRLLAAMGLDPRRGSNFDEERIIAGWLARVPPRHRWYVDIAAGDGETMSNTLALARAGWDGLAVEADPQQFERLARAYARYPRVRLARSLVTPDDVVELLRRHDVPREFGVLSLDIDGYDHFVLDRLLEAFRPDVICAEINEAIPPPVRFTVLYEPGHAIRTDRTAVGFRIGELDGRDTPRARELARIMSDVAPATVTTNLWGERWAKLGVNCMANPLAGLSGR